MAKIALPKPGVKTRIVNFGVEQDARICEYCGLWVFGSDESYAKHKRTICPLRPR